MKGMDGKKDLKTGLRKRGGGIAFLIPKMYGGGAERAVTNIAGALSEKYPVTVITLEPPEEGEEYGLSGRVRRIVADRYRGKTFRSYFDTLRQIRAIKKRERFDTVISFLPEPHFLNILSRSGERVWISIRNHTSSRRRYVPHDVFGPIAELVHPFADRVICVSEDVAADEREHYHIPAGKIVVIRNGIDPAAVREEAALPNEDGEFLGFASRFGFLFAASGRLVIQKGHWHLLRAFAALCADAKDAGLFILGDGELGERLRAEAGSLGISDRVLFCGRSVHPFRYLRYADVFVLSSLWEGLSNAVLEALALGLPIAADDCPGVRELLTPSRPYGTVVSGVLHGEYGIVTEPLDDEWRSGSGLSGAENALYLAMLELYRDPGLRDAYRARCPEALRGFRMEDRAAEWEKLLREDAGIDG